jgi:hypothetical protein
MSQLKDAGRRRWDPADVQGPLGECSPKVISDMSEQIRSQFLSERASKRLTRCERQSLLGKECQ